jgi:hypothetical protein
VKPPGANAFTLTEALIALCVLVALGATLNFFIKSRSIPVHGRQVSTTQMLSHMKQLHLATQSMALDGTTTGDTNLNWPGNVGGTFSNWATNISPAYLSEQDFRKLMSSSIRADLRGPFPSENTNGVLVYQVREESDGSVVFLTSCDFTNTPTGGSPPFAGTRPFSGKYFVVFRKAGDGAVLTGSQAGKTNLVGTFAPLCK